MSTGFLTSVKSPVIPSGATARVEDSDGRLLAEASDTKTGPFTEPYTPPGSTRPIFLTPEGRRRVVDGANTRVVSLGDNIFGIAREFWKKAIETGGTGQGFPKESRPIDVKPPQVRPIDVKPREVNTAPDGSKTYRTPEGFILPAELPELPPRKK